MIINIYMYPTGIKIDPGSKFFQYSVYAKDNNIERLQKFLEENIPKICGMIELHCDNHTSLDEVLNIVSYAHHIGAALTVYTCDRSELKSIDDLGKININIVF